MKLKTACLIGFFKIYFGLERFLKIERRKK